MEKDTQPADWRSQVLVVTGGIGSGKTSCVKEFQKLGAFTLSADELAREVVRKGSPGLKRVVEEFGTHVLDHDGTLNRKKLAEIVFADPLKRSRLEGITHPLIHSLAEERFRNALARGEKFLVYDCPLYFEAGLDTHGFSRVVVVAAKPEISLERVMRRDGISKKEAARRLGAQWPIEQKMARASYVIDNSGDKSELAKQVQEVFERELRAQK